MPHRKKEERQVAQHRCSFCGKSQDEVSRLIAGPRGVYICDECVALCNTLIQEEQQVTHKARLLKSESRQRPATKSFTDPEPEQT